MHCNYAKVSFYITIAVFGLTFTFVECANGVTLARYNLGENDPGAVAGGPGNATTVGAVGGGLVRLGSPAYSSNVPAGGSTLSMNFPGDGGAAGGTDSFYYGAAPTTDLTHDFSFSFDAYVTANPAQDFAFLASIGSNQGGIAVLQAGSQVSVFFPGVGDGTGSFAVTPGTWNKYQVDYAYNGGNNAQVTTLSVNGAVVSTRTGPTRNGLLTDAMTLGGNYRVGTPALAATRTIADFEGGFNGIIDNFVFDGFAPEVLPTLTLDRDTGSVTLAKAGGSDLRFLGYRILSDFQSLKVDGWKSIADNYDAGNPGINQVDSDDNWTKLSPNANFSLSELETDGGDGAILASGQSINLGSGNGVTTFGPWQPSFREDVRIELLLPDGSISTDVQIQYIGNGGQSFERSDLNLDGVIDAADWTIFRTGHLTDLDGLAMVNAYYRGDLDGDLDNDVDDFLLFRSDFIAASSPAAFAAAVAGTKVPEPATWIVGSLAVVGLLWIRHAKYLRQMHFDCVSFARRAIVLTAIAVSTLSNQTAKSAFQLVAQYNLGENDPGAVAGNVGNALSIGAPGPSLIRVGAPTYSSDVPTGGSTLSMLFAGDGGAGNSNDSFYYTSAPTTDYRHNISYSFDAKANAAGSDGGFSFLASLGSNWGGIAVVEIGGQVQVFSPGNDVLPTGSAPLPLDGAWHNYQVDWDATLQTSTLRLDGNVVSTHVGTPANNQIVDAFTLGGNFRLNEAAMAAPRTLSSFEGAFNGQIDNFQMFAFVYPLLTLEVNTTTGGTRILNESGEPVEFNYYSIQSASGALAPGGGSAEGDFNNDGNVNLADYTVWRDNLGSSTSLPNDAALPMPVGSAHYALWKSHFGSTGSSEGWNSLEHQDLPGFPSGSGQGDGWEELLAPTASSLAEFNLTGSSTLAAGGELSLGNAFNPSVFGAGSNGDLVFRFTTPDGTVLNGNIAYVTSGSLASVTIPEPGSILLLCLGGVVGLLHRIGRVAAARGRVQLAPVKFCNRFGLLAGAVSFLIGSSAYSAVTNDRVYRFGDADLGSFSIGDIVGSGLQTPAPTTWDSAGTSGVGNIQPLFVQGAAPGGNDPRYVAPGIGGPAGSNFAVKFDGNDFLFGRRLGLPATSDPAVSDPLDGDDTDGLAPEDYSGISNRGFQLWVKPEAIGSLQSVVMDTTQHGVQITSEGKWSLRYGDRSFDTGITATVGQWQHIMLVRPLGAEGGSRLYVNGQGVGAIGGGYEGTDNARLVVGANTSTDQGTLGMSEFFTGVIDELEMFVLGTSTVNGVNYGTFQFATDNDFAANALLGINAADVDRNGLIEPADVTLFAANFDTVHRVNGVTLPDLNFRSRGDLNYDGVIDLADAFILHNGLRSAGLGGLDFAALTNRVPEPASALLGLGGVIVAFLVGRRYRD